jgi:aminopeptidase N
MARARASSPSTKHRLPDTVRPVAYRLSLEPDLQKLAFTGTADIDVDIRKPAREVLLHAVELDIAAASINGVPAKAKLDPKTERLSLSPLKPLKKGRATVSIRFSGAISDKMRGFYRSSYVRADGSSAWMGTTQFEATNARRAFPCFDEPALKATFEVTMTVPDGRVAVSNMPEARRDGRKVTFAPTPVMSTYLLAFIVGELDWIEGRTTTGVPVRVYTPPGRRDLGRFALDTAVRGLEFFDGYYAVPYAQSVPKCDLLAIPDFEAGAMENWGAITFRETAIYIDEKKSSIAQKRRVAEVVLHELAHQWFGNLVSPEWWSYLWLNESFATFMAYKAGDALFPDWKLWEDYVAVTTAGGIALDSLRSSHPVEVPVGHPSEVDQIFDAISYNKGGSVLRMLEHAVGHDAFRDGIRAYLKTHAYACATSDDLWGAIGRDVPRMMDGWTRRTGLPVVIARRKGKGLTLAQERFFLDRDPRKPAKDPTVWDIPIPTIDAKGRRGRARLAKRTGTLDLPPDGKLNADQPGFYLVHYDDAGWEALSKGVASYPALDRYGLQADAYSLMRAAYLSVPAYLRLLQGYRGEENHHVWSGLIAALRGLAEIYLGHPSVPALEAFARDLLKPAVAKVGWEEPAGDPEHRKLLRATLLAGAVHFGEASSVDEVRRRFDRARADLASVPPNLQGLVFSGAARHGGDEVLDHLVALHEKADLPETKVRLLSATGAFRREAPLRKAVDYTLSSGKVRPQDGFYVFSSVPIESRAAAWALLKEHWAVIDQRYGKSHMLNAFVSAGAGIPSEAHAKDMEAFFRKHPAPFASERIRQTLEGIRARAKFRARNAAALTQFFGGGVR